MRSAFQNRLAKTLPARRRWARAHGLTAYRVYDGDIPEYRFAVDVYADHAHVTELARRGFVPEAKLEARRREVRAAIPAVLGIPDDHVHWKTKAPKVWGSEQYEKVAARGERLEVEEGGVRLLVNLTDYVDTGLFLDHRPLRMRVQAEAGGRRFLNLFCYTGAFTVHAAKGGAAATTSVDLSSTYLAWARDNLELNGLWNERRHQLVRSDVLRWIAGGPAGQFDLVVLDPPSFSASKRMETTFEVQRDHVGLLRSAARLLAPTGVLYFSTNFREFQLDRSALQGLRVEDITAETIPDDFRDRKIHRAFRLTHI